MKNNTTTSIDWEKSEYSPEFQKEVYKEINNMLEYVSLNLYPIFYNYWRRND